VPNGAGKTTSLSMAVGLLRPAAGCRRANARRDSISVSWPMFRSASCSNTF